MRSHSAIEQMNNEARKNYLYRHALNINEILQRLNNQSLASITDKKFAALDNYTAINFLEAQLKNALLFLTNGQFISGDHLPYISQIKIALLPKGSDVAGIRTNIANHIAKLGLQNRRPCVDLEKDGLHTNWDNEIAARKYLELLQDIGINAHLTTSWPKVPDYDQATHAVVISHKDVEKYFREFCQYHPYNVAYATNDLYAQVKINRPSAQLDAIKNNYSFSPLLKTVEVSNTTRTEITKDIHLVSISLDTLPPKKQNGQPLHLIFLLDDSGSMKGPKMDAANKALKDFIESEPDDTLISIQPFNADTIVAKMSVGEIKRMGIKVDKTPATGGTPLIEMLATSALFLRAKSNKYLLTENDLNNAIVIMLTDGQANGSAKDAISAMQESSKTNFLSRAVNLEKLNLTREQASVSYGMNHFACKQLPVVFFIAIGSDSDQKFIAEISHLLSTPYAFVDDKAATMQQQINDAVNLLRGLKGRIPSTTLTLEYFDTKTNQTVVVSKETNNLFCGRTREVDFEIPSTATHIRIWLMADEMQNSYPVTSTLTKNPIFIKSYIENNFLAISQDYSLKSTRISDNFLQLNYDTPIFFGGIDRGCRHTQEIKIDDDFTESHNWDLFCATNLEQINPKAFARNTVCLFKVNKNYHVCFIQNQQFSSFENKRIIEDVQTRNIDVEIESGKIAIDKSNEGFFKPLIQTAVKHLLNKIQHDQQQEKLQTAFEQLKKETTEKIQALQSICSPDNETFAELQLFLDTINRTKINEHFASNDVHTERHMLAKATQNRLLGTPMLVENLVKIEEPIFTAIENIGTIFDSNMVLAQIRQNSDLLAVKQKTNPHHATPLIYLMVLCSEETNYGRKAILSDTIKSIVQEFECDLFACDTYDNTLLHRAAWGGEFELLKILIEKAKQAGSLNRLQYLRNKNVFIGATEGETFVELIRTSQKFSTAQKNDLLAMMSEKILSLSLLANINANKLDEVREIIANDTQELNRHADANIKSPTPLLAMLYQLVHIESNNAALRHFALELLHTHKKTIDLNATDDQGNNLLHYALFHGEFVIAKKIIEIAKEKNILPSLLKARNVLANADNKGETPLISLLNQYKLCGDAFNGMCTVMNALFTPETNDFSSVPESVQVAFDNTFSRFMECRDIYLSVAPSLTNLQIAEISHLKIVHDKYQQGYSAYYWLKAAPVLELKKLITDCNDLLTAEFTLEDRDTLQAFHGMADALLKSTITHTEFSQYISQILYDKPPQHQAVRDLFKRAEAVMAQHDFISNAMKPVEVVNLNPVPHARRPKQPSPPAKRAREASLRESHGFIQRPRDNISLQDVLIDRNKDVVLIYHPPGSAIKIYDKIPESCKKFIVLDKDDKIIMKKSNRQHKKEICFGFYSAIESNFGTNFPTKDDRDICQKVLRLYSEHIFRGKTTGPRSTALYFQPAFFDYYTSIRLTNEESNAVDESKPTYESTPPSNEFCSMM